MKLQVFFYISTGQRVDKAAAPLPGWLSPPRLSQEFCNASLHQALQSNTMHDATTGKPDMVGTQAATPRAEICNGGQGKSHCYLDKNKHLTMGEIKMIHKRMVGPCSDTMWPIV